ncbi:MAG TPA: WecB/TagA/CpsF family glycosyltransferase [Chitinophagaceae bacterium]|nr:WecB/TagA/CpsF family glycosyltransferase [Chitinophagaceae bacterium]
MNNLSGLKILNVPVTPATVENIFDYIDITINYNAGPKMIGYVNLHGLYVSIKNISMHQYYSITAINYVDGTPVIWILKLMGHKVDINYRITFLDFYLDFFKHCKQKEYRVLWLGGEQESLSKGITIIKRDILGVIVHGVNGYKTDDEYLEEVKLFKPHIILLGFGMPKQEEWVLRNKDKIEVNIVWNVGATIDFISGKAITPPRWTGKFGIEWFFRFINEPKRMFFRYFCEPLIIVAQLIKGAIKKVSNCK